MSTLPTSTQLGNTSIVKYIDDDGTTSRDCTTVVKRNDRRCKEFTLKKMSTIRGAMLVFKC